MHPAKSVILFTVLSGLGLGLLNVAFLSYLGGHASSERSFIIIALGLGLLSAGLTSSFLHLGHPERAWRAFSQWRSSWLSREGCSAILSYVVPSIFLLEFLYGFINNETIMLVLAILGLIINLTTIHCTAMIYASLTPIPAWHNFFTPMNYQLLSMMSGFVVVAFLISLWGIRPPPMGIFILLSVSLAAIGKLHYWKFLRNKSPRFNMNQALGVAGEITPFDPPHSSANYLMKEMIFAWGRENKNRLEKFALVLGFFVPLLYGVLSFFLHNDYYIIAGSLAVVFMFIGLLIERWLFFACAEHSISLYYGNNQV